ncbi:GNAT family N-acetyltransferase [Desnuesiella massiliensis]|uniref:GNAT family N-acetyltransferase n=1 Tax=Desnuesiella massiliensis TaxID=1650662 RepID=UPI0006E2D0E9|nr:GNAT family N-acetyltransferase [Desnuesiella massiliensis]
MIFEKLNEKYLEDAVKLTQAQYNMEQKHIEALYEKDYKDILTDMLSDIFKNKRGLVAVERGKVLGYLSFWGSVNGHFGNVKGSFSPLFANAYGGENRGKIASLLFQYTSEEMIKEEILSYAICLYSHDAEVMQSLMMNGFGVRCGDAIRNVNKLLNIEINTEYSYDEIHYSKAGCLLTLSNSLERHMRKSPTYFPKEELSEEKFTERCYNRQSRFFIAKDKSEIIGYLEVANDGETFISEEPDYLHICGAYLKEGYRGKNIIQSLLSFVIETLKKDDIKRLGVDFETINPTALKFWEKFFDSYTYSFVRRIDERILR